MLLQELALRGVAAPATEVTSFFGTSTQLWAVGLILLRLASMIMLMPGLGDQAVPARLRIGLAFMLALVITPIVGNTLPALPNSLGEMLGIALHEIVIGLMMGTLMRVLIFAMVVAGEVMSLQTTLSFAQTANPAQAQPSTSLGTFLAMMGMVLIYSTNLHHLFIRAMVDSYQVFAPTRDVMVGDATTLMMQTVSKTFVLALQMSAPLIAFALIFNVATGFIGRMMPNFPVFFAATPVQVLAGLSILALGLGATGMVFIEHYEELLAYFIKGVR